MFRTPKRMFRTPKSYLTWIAAIGLPLISCDRDRDTQPKPPLAPITDHVPDRSGADQASDQVATDRARAGDGDRDGPESLNAALAAAAAVKAELEAGDGGPSGTVFFSEHGDAVRIVAIVEGLPAGKHAIHIHEKGDCSAADFKSAGGHFNPEKTAHDAPYAARKHLGDMGNLVTNERGTAIFGMELVGAALGEGDGSSRASLAGKAVIIHQGTDDLKSQPSGDAGSRIACAVIPSR